MKLLMEGAGSSWAEILIGPFLAGAAGSVVCTQLLIKPSQAKSDTFILFPLYSVGKKTGLKCLEIGSLQSKDRLFGAYFKAAWIKYWNLETEVC